MTALDQINRGAQQQSSAARQSVAAIAQIERARRSRSSDRPGLENGERSSKQIGDTAPTSMQLIVGVTQSLRSTNKTRDQVARSEAGKPEDRQDRRRHFDGRDPDQHARGQRLDRSRARRGVRQGVHGGLDRHPQSCAGFVGERRTDQGPRQGDPGPDRRRPPRPREISVSTASEVEKNKAHHQHAAEPCRKILRSSSRATRISSTRPIR